MFGIALDPKVRFLDRKRRGVTFDMNIEMKKIIESYHQRPYPISPFVGNTARLLVAVIGGLLVLIPMMILANVLKIELVLLSTFLFTIFFSVAVSVMSRASNDQIIVATAAYGAVLVVFVANILPRPPA
jgi:glycopeptide antibiotics resistance protein